MWKNKEQSESIMRIRRNWSFMAVMFEIAGQG